MFPLRLGPFYHMVLTDTVTTMSKKIEFLKFLDSRAISVYVGVGGFTPKIKQEI
jgi:hypothetical protein